MTTINSAFNNSQQISLERFWETLKPIEAEIWKDIIGWEGYYQVSNYGNVKSLSRHIDSGRGGQRIIKGRIIKPFTESKISYLVVRLCRNSKETAIPIHRLVGQHFIPNPLTKPQINHIDGNPKNNHVSNLEWCTASENMIHAFKVLGRKNSMAGVTGENNKLSKPVYVTKLGSDKTVRFASLTLACKATSSLRSNASAACLGKYKTHNGFKFQYEQPIPITFSEAVAAQDEISSKQKHEEFEQREIEQERIMRHGDRGAFENG